jgi:hypothetical protein
MKKWGCYTRKSGSGNQKYMVESSKMLVELSNMGIFGWSMD